MHTHPEVAQRALVGAVLEEEGTHRCHVLEFRGSSYRFRQSLAAREGRLDEAFVTSIPD